MKSDEALFLKTLVRERPEPNSTGLFATEIGARLGIPAKRVDYLLMKWTKKGWWNYGVSMRSGWLEADGLVAAWNLK